MTQQQLCVGIPVQKVLRHYKTKEGSKQNIIAWKQKKSKTEMTTNLVTVISFSREKQSISFLQQKMFKTTNVFKLGQSLQITEETKRWSSLTWIQTAHQSSEVGPDGFQSPFQLQPCLYPETTTTFHVLLSVTYFQLIDRQLSHKELRWVKAWHNSAQGGITDRSQLCSKNQSVIESQNALG